MFTIRHPSFVISTMVRFLFPLSRRLSEGWCKSLAVK